MKFKNVVFALSLLLFIACNNEEVLNETTTNIPTTTSTSINKIMPLGASRVEGARPQFESYRYELWKDLIENNWNFDFVGTQLDNATYPEYNGNNFDTNHEGRSGWTSGQILTNIDNWLNQTGMPDIVLFSSPAGNDALEALPYDEAVSNINAIIDILQANNPNVTIVIEQMAPGRTDIMTATLTSYFEQMQQEVLSIVTNQTTATSQVIAVNMFTGFNDNYLADEVHYNEAGASFIADKYYNVLETIME